jgi:hypothetical protein
MLERIEELQNLWNRDEDQCYQEIHGLSGSDIPKLDELKGLIGNYPEVVGAIISFHYPAEDFFKK